MNRKLALILLSLSFIMSPIYIYSSIIYTQKNVNTFSPDIAVVLGSGTAGTSEIGVNGTSAMVNVTASRNWWNTDYDYRRQTSIVNNIASTLGSGYSAYLTVNTTSLVSTGKMLPSGNDLRILYWNTSSSSWVELDRDVIGMNTSSTQVWFKTQADIGASPATDNDYYVYYGNPSATSPPANRSNVYVWFDDFSTNTLANYDKAKWVDVHGGPTQYVLPTYDAANERVWFDTGDNYASDMYPIGVSEADFLMEVDFWANGSYPTDATIALVGRLENPGTSSTHYYLDFSHGAYDSPGITVDSWVNGERSNTVYSEPTDYYWAFNEVHTFRYAIFGTTHKFWWNSDIGDPPNITATDSLHTAAGRLGLVPAQVRGWWDNFKVRRYLEPEPSTYTGSEESNIEDYVDNNTSDVDSSADKGTHSNFSAQQAGPDSVFDTLTEEETASTSGYRIQQGDFLFQGTDAYIPLDYGIDVDHSFVIMPNLMWQENVTAATSGDPAINDDNAFVTAYLYNSTHIRVQRWSSSDGDLRIGWQVLECFDEEFTVQRGEKYVSSLTSQTVTDTTSSPVDPTKSMAWHYWRTSYIDRDGRASQFYSNVTDSTTITFERQGTANVTGYLRWVVVEWNTSKIDHFAQGYVTGYGTETSPFIDSIGTTTNESQSILIFQTHAIGDNGLDTSTTAGYIYNNTHVAFYNYDSTFNRGVKWYVIDFGPGVGSRQDDDYEPWGSTDYDETDPLNPAVRLNRTLVWLSATSNGDGRAKPRHTQWWYIDATNTTHSSTIHYQRRYGGQAREVAWQVLELPYSTSYELDLEVQWTSVDYDEANEELSIYGGTMESENITVDVWNGSAWKNLFTDLSSGWNNVSVSPYLTSSNFTIRFKGGNETGDTTQDSWNIDATLLHVWTDGYTYDYILSVISQKTYDQNIRLNLYDYSNIGRLSNSTIWFRDGTTSFQINITSGVVIQDVGPWYLLPASETRYIVVYVEESTSGTSVLFIKLEAVEASSIVYTCLIELTVN